LEGPIIVIPTAGVLSIRYENGMVDIRNPFPPPKSSQTGKLPSAANTDKLNFGINADPSGIIFNGVPLTLDFTKGRFNSQINILTPSAGSFASFNRKQNLFGIGLRFNYFAPGRIGGFYAGGMAEYSLGKISSGSLNSIALALNSGFKFSTASGMYFRTGGIVGISFDIGAANPVSMVLRPDISVGYNF
jgi:hypothetical protein